MEPLFKDVEKDVKQVEKFEVTETKKFRKFIKALGPGFITGASDDDPSGIGTYSQTGAQFGYTQLWTSLFALPFMTAIQEMCGRIGMVTGKGLASVIRGHYARPVLYAAVLLLFAANTINVGADLGAMAASGRLLVGIPFWVWLVIITGTTVLLEVFVSYPAYARFLKYLTLSLFAYIITAFVVRQPWHHIAASTFIPSFSSSRAYLMNIVAILGTTISPYLFFWEADQESEEDAVHHRSLGAGLPRVTNRDLRGMRIDTMVGMVFSQLVMFFIVVTAASTLGAHGITSITTADQAASALRPLAGQFAYLLFAVGIIGTGLLAVPVLAGSASYALAESIGWRAGLRYKFKQAHAFYVVIAISTVIGLAINFTPIKPFQLLYYTAIFNGLVAPPLMILIMLISNNKNIMGEHTNGRFSNLFGWLITAGMSLCAVALLASLAH